MAKIAGQNLLTAMGLWLILACAGPGVAAEQYGVFGKDSGVCLGIRGHALRSHQISGNETVVVCPGRVRAEEKKERAVAVVVRLAGEVSFSRPSIQDELAKEVSVLLQANVKNVQVVSPLKVAKWIDENEWTEFTDVAKAVKAETVIGIDLLEFSLFQGQTLYQGNALAAIRVYDITNDDRLVFEKNLRPASFPSDAGTPTSERPEEDFRREYVRVLADNIARHFYADSEFDVTTPSDSACELTSAAHDARSRPRCKGYVRRLFSRMGTSTPRGSGC